MTSQTFTVENDTEITVEGITFKIYRDALWVDGGEQDDWDLRDIETLEDNDEAEITITDKDLDEAAFYLWGLEDNVTVLRDNSSKPYAWMLENVDVSEIDDAAAWVQEYARTAVNATNHSDLSDAIVLRALRNAGQIEAATVYVQSRINEYELTQVMTPAEIEAEFDLAEGTVRKAIERGFTARKADERTWLVHRKDAEKRWKK